MKRCGSCAHSSTNLKRCYTVQIIYCVHNWLAKSAAEGLVCGLLIRDERPIICLF